jgi:hypothetical protein
MRNATWRGISPKVLQEPPMAVGRERKMRNDDVPACSRNPFPKRRAFQWPQSLAECAWIHAEGPDERFVALREFALAFYTAKHADRSGMLAEEPRETGDAVHDAILGAVAEHFSWEYDLTAPAWSEGGTRFLPEPYYFFEADKRPECKEETHRRTPPAYARRNILTGCTPLIRAGKYTDTDFAGEPELFFARVRTKEPRVLLPPRWRIVPMFVDEAQRLVEGQFSGTSGRVPDRGNVPDGYYLSMAINELKLRGGDAGREAAMELVDRMETAHYANVISELRTPIPEKGSDEEDIYKSEVSDGWMRLKDITDELQSFLESEMPEVASRCPRRPGICVTDSVYFDIAIRELKKFSDGSGYSIAIKFVDKLEAGGRPPKTLNYQDNCIDNEDGQAK